MQTLETKSPGTLEVWFTPLQGRGESGPVILVENGCRGAPEFVIVLLMRRAIRVEKPPSSGRVER